MASKASTRLSIPVFHSYLRHSYTQCLLQRPLHTASHQPLPRQPHTHLRPLTQQPQQQRYSTEPPGPKLYTHEEVAALSSNPDPKRIIIDVREPSELAQSGKIPGAYSMPLTSNPDAFYLSNEDFFDRFGFEKPRAVNMISGSREGKRGTTSESPYTAKMKQREANSGLNSDDGSIIDSEKINREAGYGGGGKDETEDGDGEGVEEVLFYCRKGVRSRAAARMAREWQGISIGDMTGGFVEWEGKGGKIER